MPEVLESSYPFVTRKMLAFEHGQVFQLQIQAQSNVAGSVNIRGLTKEGVFSFTHTLTSAGAFSSQSFAIPDVPIWVAVIDESNTFAQGDNFITLLLLANRDILYEYGSQPVYAQKSLAWPIHAGDNPRPNGGRIRSFAGTDRAAGSEISETVPNGRIWRIISVNFTLVAAAAAASRRVHLNITDGTNVLFDAFGSVDQIISETKIYTFANYGATPDETDDNDILVNIPGNLILNEGSVIRTQTTALDAGDNFGAPTILLEEFFNRP